MTTFTAPSEEETLVAVLTEPPGHERRTSIRHPCGLEANCSPIALLRSDPWPVVIRDISRTGVGLVLDYPLPPGTFMALELPQISTQPIKVIVTCIRQQLDESWILGCAFSRELRFEQVEALVGA
ncbi:MAG: PilZ domain-containing protein [Gemmataceae bacterium]|nr:PilZ domain-containing protein [Gemmataceae bacterium]